MPKAKKAAAKKTSDTASILLNVFDGERKPLPDGANLLVRIADGSQQQLVNRYFKKSTIQFKVPFSDNFKDNYTVLVACDGYRDAGFFPVKVTPDLPQEIDLILVPRDAEYHFVKWAELAQTHAEISNFLCCSGDAGVAQQHYEDLMETKPAGLAAMMNVAEAMRVIHLPRGTPLNYFKEIEWDSSLAQDRFFAYADLELLTQVRLAAQQDEFDPEPNPGLFHPDATSSYKQNQFGEANVQLTFHEKNTKKIGNTKCVMVEPDIDYYKDAAAHALLEVIPNALGHGFTDPQIVYVLRWIAGRHAGVPEFDPPYFLA